MTLSFLCQKLKGKRKLASNCYSNLNTILHNPTEDIDYPIGLFTAQERTRWVENSMKFHNTDRLNYDNK